MELLLAAVVLLALRGSATSTPNPDDKGEGSGTAPGGRNGRGVDVGGLIGSGVGAIGAIAGLAGGGSGTALLAGGGTVVGGKVATTTTTATTAAGVGGGVSVAAVAAVVIVVAWVTMVTIAIFAAFDAATRRAWRAGLGKQGLKTYTMVSIRQSENRFAKQMIQASGGSTTDETQPAVLGGNGWIIVPEYRTIQLVSGVSTDKLNVITIAARFLAVAQIRARNDVVRSFFAQDFANTPAQIAAAGDAMEAADFEALVAEHYQTNFLNVPGAPTWEQARPFLPTRIHAVARFGGQMLGVQYTLEQLRGGTLFPAGIRPIDAITAAAAEPAGQNVIAYQNRVYGLGHEQRANVLYDNEAQLAWLPNYSNGAQVTLYPYDTRPFVGPGVGA